MEEPNIINYVQEATPAKFRMYLRGPVRFGRFFATRFLWNIEAEGRTWQENIFVIAVGLLTSATVIIDCVCIVVEFIARLFWYVLKSFVRLIFYAVKVVLDKLFGTALRWITIITIILILYFKWDEISEILRLWRW